MRIVFKTKLTTNDFNISIKPENKTVFSVNVKLINTIQNSKNGKIYSENAVILSDKLFPCKISATKLFEKIYHKVEEILDIEICDVEPSFGGIS